ncbi:unnamed protein product, partial [Symbiodinium sp. CCMP2592]
MQCTDLGMAPLRIQALGSLLRSSGELCHKALNKATATLQMADEVLLCIDASQVEVEWNEPEGAFQEPAMAFGTPFCAALFARLRLAEAIDFEEAEKLWA